MNLLLQFRKKHSVLAAQLSLTTYIAQCTLALLLSFTATAQNNVGIGTTTPNSKAMLELQAIDKGFLAPRMTALQMNAISTPPNGLLVYNTTANCFYYYNAIMLSWKSMCNINSTGHDTLVLNLVQIDSLFSHYIKTDTLLSKTIITKYLKADTGYIKFLISQYIKTDSIKAHFGRFDSLYINGQNITDYINTQLSTKDTVVLKYLRTDSIYSMLIRADSAFIKSILTNTLTAHYVTTDSLYAHLGRFDSLYVGGKNISQIISDSIAAQAWLLKGNNVVGNSYKLGTINNKSLRLIANNNERLTIASATGYVGINQTVPTQHLDVAGNLQFSKALMPATNPGVVGEILTSAGPNTAPTWTNPANINTTAIAGTGTTAPLFVLNGIADIAYKNASSQGVILIAPNNTCWKLTVGNTGNLITQSVTCP
jgi:hypothetical protein